MVSLTPTIISLSAGLIIGIIGYFLKRTMNRVDKNELDISHVKENYTSSKTHEDDVSECKTEIKKIREDYTPKQVHEKDFDECKNDIKFIKEDYITKEDFFREQSKTDRKLDRIMDILLEMKGENKNGQNS